MGSVIGMLLMGCHWHPLAGLRLRDMTPVNLEHGSMRYLGDLMGIRPALASASEMPKIIKHAIRIS